jgi:hypothetical protein
MNQFIPAEIWASFIPSWVQAGGLLAVLASGLVMLVLGRTVLGRHTLPEIALIAGWGVIALVLTLWGVLTPQSMHIPAVALIGAAAISAVLPRGRLGTRDLTTIGRVLILALPLLAVFAAADPSQPDTFTNQLPNAAYLHDYGKFPGTDRPPMLALWPAFPYNLQLAAFIPSLLVPEYPTNLLTDFNLLLQFAFAALLARTMRRSEPIDATPSWASIGAAILLTTFLNPGFNPKIQFSGYGDPAIAIAVAFAAWQAERLLAALAAERSPAPERLSLTLVLIAGVAIKQVSVFLMAAVVGSAFLIGAFDKRVGPRRALTSLAPAFLPAVLLVGVWRIYVAIHFTPDDELRLMPFSDWSLSSLPAILENMALKISQRAPFFVLLYGVALSAPLVAKTRGLTPAVRLFLMTLGVTLAYTAFLIFTYVAHFPGAIGASAHSFFRYNTHLGLLVTLAVAAFARESWLRRGAPALGRAWRSVEIGAIVLALAAPVAAARWIRHDQREPQPLVWDLARFAAPHFHEGDRIGLLLPGDNRSVALMLRVAIALTEPRHGLAAFDDFGRADSATLATALHNGDGHVLISCVPPALADSAAGRAIGLTSGKAALLGDDSGHWTLTATYAYPDDLPAASEWTAELSPGPFCR